MAFISSKISFIIFFLTLLTTQIIHARESQFFNKIPSTNNNQPKEEDPLDKLEQEPNFIPENQNGGGGGYGLYGHESGQLPPSTTTATTTPTSVNTNLPFKNEPNNYQFVPKYLPQNYNTEAYVTEAEGYHPAQESNTNNYYNADIDVDSQNSKQGYPATTTTAANEGVNYFQNPKQSYPATTTTAADEGINYYQNPKQGYPATTTTAGNEGVNYFQNPKQGYPATEDPKQGYPTTTTAGNEGVNYYQNPKQSYPATTTAAANEGNNYYQNPKQSYPTTAAEEGDNYYQNPKQDYPATTTTVANEGENYYPNPKQSYQKYGGNGYNGQEQGLNEYNFGQKGYTTTTSGGKYSNNYNNAAEKQGMSDTRFLENGKYYYDLSLEENDKYPFDSISTTRFEDQYKKYGAYNGNNINENTYGAQFQDLQDDEGLP